MSSITSESLFEREPSATMVTPKPQPRVSERALDATTFFLADVADGLGPFLVIDLTSRRHWSSGEAGLAMSMMLLGTVLSQAFMGAWIDRTKAKRALIAVGSLIVASTSIGLYYFRSKAEIYGLQFLTGIAVTIFPPAIAAISLGLVGRNRFPARAGRNEACFHAGNVASAGLAAVAGWIHSGGVFFSVAAMALASSFSSRWIRETDIDHRLACGADGLQDDGPAIPLKTLMSDSRLLRFIAAVVLFHFANAAMLPLLGQKLAADRAESASSLMAVCILVAQLAMIPVAILASRMAISGRRPVFLIAFAILPIRGIFYTLTDSSALLIANQILDGVGAGIFGVVALLVTADLTRGTGRFNFVQGLTATSIGLGAALSNTVTGLIVDAGGFNAGFLFLSAVAVAAALVFVTAVPETVNPAT
ncbi:MFS transporter [Schlesneria paludicola]|uniref:MFS transporter n=1 Tax=Schlesneria paludicola TaxID=360056 RepID=UPI00029A05AE|nr:MFS transporter [Schlesneria paludicola]